MKGRLYTLLRLKADYQLRLDEKLLRWMVKDASHEEYLRNLIELRNSGHIHEENNGMPVYYRPHYLTEKGYDYLPKVKRLYLKKLWMKNRWKVIAWLIPVLLTIVFGLIGLLKT